MFRWFSRVRARFLPPIETSEYADEPDEDRADPRVDELLESVQKLARAQAKLSVRIEGFESKLEGGFGEIRAGLAEMSSRASSAGSLNWNELLDSMDVLEEACRSVEERGEREVVSGLRGALERLDRFLSEQGGLSRVDQTNGTLDGKIFRIVAVDERLGPPDSVITRVVRAAVLRGDELIREGELIVNRRQ
jgi:molecular chaperone GrpE (heat shock protein)